MTGNVIYMRRIDRATVRRYPNCVFVFGDNLARSGLGGQAMAMRGEPNAIGVATKRYPSMGAECFFLEADVDALLPIVDADLDKVQAAFEAGKTIYLPLDGLGTGLAELPARAPTIHRHIVNRIKAISPDCPWSAP